MGAGLGLETARAKQRGRALTGSNPLSVRPPRPVHKNPCLVVGCTDEEALKEAFEKHGTVEGIHVPEGQNFAFVRFGTTPPLLPPIPSHPGPLRHP